MSGERFRFRRVVGGRRIYHVGVAELLGEEEGQLPSVLNALEDGLSKRKAEEAAWLDPAEDLLFLCLQSLM